uniref:Serine aminopeptidase S33 domain-containing protein n=1 Tax=Aplanochytrium stocchinoi TaxID=215587 RepID=A0A7S3PFG1_9STRA|mmetsp:Transcript_6787/g.8873  ORF Transcript_6787/g.8873 Transcript_6787/m.8873 type:complete len:495 (+) Transcript_6787:204-1688(+)
MNLLASLSSPLELENPTSLAFGALVAFVAMGLFRWFKDLHEPVRVLYHEHDLVWATCRYADVFQKGYRPPWWVSFGSLFFSGTWHTLAHNIIREFCKQPEVKYEREFVRLKDGGTVGLDWAVSSRCPSSKELLLSPDISDDSYPIVFLHHGLCGSSRSHYVLSAVNYFLKTQKYRVVVMVARGCGEVPLTTSEGFNAARADDIRQALNLVFERHPTSHVFGVGWSLGAGLMANYIGEEGNNCRLSGACVISPCWDFMARSPWFPIWSKMFLGKSLVDYTKVNKEAFMACDKIDLDKGLAAAHVAEYDHHIIVQRHDKYETIDDYYRDASPLKVARNITIPTLSINSDDDPVCSVDGCPTDKAIMGPGLTVLRTKRGGHTSWAKHDSAHTSWMDEAILTWINACNDNLIRLHNSSRNNFENSSVSTSASSGSASEAGEENENKKFEVIPNRRGSVDDPTSYRDDSLQPDVEKSTPLFPLVSAAAAAYLSYRIFRR